MTEPAQSTEPVVRITGLSKRYRVGRRVRAVPVPKILGFAPPDASQKGRYDDVEDEDEEEIDEEEDDARGGRTNREIWALRDISFEVSQGASIGIIGRNGAGKSTLLKVLSRITPPTAGRVELRGRVAPLLELAAGFLQPDSTGPDNVRLLGRFFGVPRVEVERSMKTILAFAELDGLEHAQLKRYSTGMTRRLAFSVALNLEADVLLSDGILGVGDSDFRRRCFDLVRKRNQAGLALLFASHETKTVRNMCTEVLWLEDGTVHRHGPADEVLDEYERLDGGSRQAARTGNRSISPEEARATKERAAQEAIAVKLEVKRRAADEKATQTEANEVAVLQEARIITPEGEPVHALGRDEPATVEVEAAVHLAAGVVVKIMLYGPGGLQRRLRGPLDWSIERSSSFIARVDLPPGALPGGRYTAAAAVWVTAQGIRRRVIRPSAFTFDVDETGDDESDETPETDGWVPGASNWRIEVRQL